ncbi:MAG: T9SS type A sorting domain-containing protein [Bacteroidia bacterium]|nr:T9SS type A sorting domain-containing protein [Bacteroidia bacterium]
MKKLAYVIVGWIGMLGMLSMATAQNGELEVVSPAGEAMSTSDMNVSWTLGELVVETYSGTDIVLTSGFEQPKSIPTSIEGFEVDFGKVKVFPNPVSQTLFIEREKSNGSLNLNLYDISGKHVLSTSIKSLSGEINMSNLAKGTYTLRLSDSKGAQKTVRVRKL